MLLWATFHLRNMPVPEFIPDFSDPKFGEFGRRDWYKHLLFFSSKGSPTVPMKYKSKCFSNGAPPQTNSLTQSNPQLITSGSTSSISGMMYPLPNQHMQAAHSPHKQLALMALASVEQKRSVAGVRAGHSDHAMTVHFPPTHSLERPCSTLGDQRPTS